MIRAPPLFDGFRGTADVDNAAVSPPLSHEEMEIGPKAKVNLSTGVSTPLEGRLNRRRRSLTQRGSPGFAATPLPPRPLNGVFQPRGGCSAAGPQTISQYSPADLFPVKILPAVVEDPMHSGQFRPLLYEIRPPSPKNAIAPLETVGVIVIPPPTVAPPVRPARDPRPLPSTRNYDWNQNRRER